MIYSLIPQGRTVHRPLFLIDSAVRYCPLFLSFAVDFFLENICVRKKNIVSLSEFLVTNIMSEQLDPNKYSADNIQSLEGMEHVRVRPSMYIGDVGVRGLHH